MNVRSLFASTVLLAVSGIALGGTWERFRGPGGLGVAQNQNLPTQFDDKTNLVWKVAIPGLGNSSPIVWNEQLIVQSSTPNGDERILLSLDARTGKTLWERKFPGVKAHTHAKNTLASATPATDGESIFVPIWDGKDVILHALTMKGEPIWHKNMGEFKSQHGPGASPVIYRDKVFYPFDMDGKAIFYAFDKKTGNEAWTAPRKAHRACYNPPQILEKGANGTELIVTSTTAITSYNPDTGSQNWEWNWTFTGKMPLRTIGPSIELDGMLFAFSGDGGGDRTMAALDLPTSPGAKPVQAWGKDRKEFPYVPGVLTHGKHLYFVNDNGYAGCVEAKTGNKVWYERLPEAKFTASPVLVDGKIYAGSEEGDVFVINATPKFETPVCNRLGDRIRATPAVVDGRLFIRGTKYLYCFGKKD